MAKHVGVKDFKCSYCEKTFSRKEFLQDHINYHENNKSKRCTFCERCFVTKTELNIHIDKYHKNTKFDQKENNITHVEGNSPKELPGLKNEMEKAPVPKIKNFKCERCDSEFFNNSSLKIHIAFIHDKTLTI